MEHLVTTPCGKDLFHRRLTAPYSLGPSPFDDADYVALIINNDPSISEEDQNAISLALVQSGCRYAVCTGHDCSSWDDSVDWAYLEVDPDLSDNTFVMTTWHEDDTPEEIAHFFIHCTEFDGIVFDNYLVLSVGLGGALLPQLKHEFIAV